MNIVIIGRDMIITLVIIMAVFTAFMLFYLMYVQTISAYKDRDMSLLGTMAFIWAFIIGTALIIIGSA